MSIHLYVTSPRSNIHLVLTFIPFSLIHTVFKSLAAIYYPFSPISSYFKAFSHRFILFSHFMHRILYSPYIYPHSCLFSFIFPLYSHFTHDLTRFCLISACFAALFTVFYLFFISLHITLTYHPFRFSQHIHSHRYQSDPSVFFVFLPVFFTYPTLYSVFCFVFCTIRLIFYLSVSYRLIF